MGERDRAGAGAALVRPVWRRGAHGRARAVREPGRHLRPLVRRAGVEDRTSGRLSGRHPVQQHHRAKTERSASGGPVGAERRHSRPDRRRRDRPGVGAGAGPGHGREPGRIRDGRHRRRDHHHRARLQPARGDQHRRHPVLPRARLLHRGHQARRDGGHRRCHAGPAHCGDGGRAEADQRRLLRQHAADGAGSGRGHGLRQQCDGAPIQRRRFSTDARRRRTGANGDTARQERGGPAGKRSPVPGLRPGHADPDLGQLGGRGAVLVQSPGLCLYRPKARRAGRFGRLAGEPASRGRRPRRRDLGARRSERPGL